VTDARRLEPIGARADEPLRLLVAIPALNESATIADVVRGVPERVEGVGPIEILVIDDGSSDDTAALASEVGARVIRHPAPRGVGAAFQTALSYGIESGADVIVTLDGDGQFDPADIPKLAAPVISGEAEFTTASRFADPALEPDMPAIKRWGNRMMSRLISRLAGQRIFDVSCGMRCYGRDAALQLNLRGSFTYTQEVLLNLAFRNVRILEVPIRVRGERESGKSRVANNLWRYAFRTIQIIFRCYRDYYPLRFFGTLALILLAPAALLLGFLGIHYLTTDAFTPYKWTGFAAAALGLMALVMFHLGLTGDLLVRHRTYLEEILYRQRLDARRRD
jgi:glycosyltransferase involved in cell wall biosynthesis